MSILAVGSIAFDSITTPSGRVDNVLGGSATYFSLAASYFTEVRVVAVVGEDFGAEHENVLKKRGIDTRGIEHAPGQDVSAGAGSTRDNLNEAKTDFTELNVFEKVPAAHSGGVQGFGIPVSGEHSPQLAGGGAARNERCCR